MEFGKFMRWLRAPLTGRVTATRGEGAESTSVDDALSVDSLEGLSALGVKQQCAAAFVCDALREDARSARVPKLTAFRAASAVDQLYAVLRVYCPDELPGASGESADEFIYRPWVSIPEYSFCDGFSPDGLAPGVHQAVERGIATAMADGLNGWPSPALIEELSLSPMVGRSRASSVYSVALSDGSDVSSSTVSSIQSGDSFEVDMACQADLGLGCGREHTYRRADYSGEQWLSMMAAMHDHYELRGDVLRTQCCFHHWHEDPICVDAPTAFFVTSVLPYSDGDEVSGGESVSAGAVLWDAPLHRLAESAAISAVQFVRTLNAYGAHGTPLDFREALGPVRGSHVEIVGALLSAHGYGALTKLLDWYHEAFPPGTLWPRAYDSDIARVRGIDWFGHHAEVEPDFWHDLGGVACRRYDDDGDYARLGYVGYAAAAFVQTQCALAGACLRVVTRASVLQAPVVCQMRANGLCVSMDAIYRVFGFIVCYVRVRDVIAMAERFGLVVY